MSALRTNSFSSKVQPRLIQALGTCFVGATRWVALASDSRRRYRSSVSFLQVSLGIALLAILLASCTPYSFSGGRTALIKTIAVPVFENETSQFGLAEALTAGVVDGLVADNQVKVEDASRAEAVLNGRVLDYQRKAYTFDQNDQVKEYLVEIWVAADLVKRDGSGSVWTAASIRGFGDYAADSSETLGQQRAIKKITEDIINRTVKSW